jgi:hypothetical protein
VPAEEPEPIVLVEEAAVEPTPLPVSDPTIPFTVKSPGSRGEVAEEPEPIVMAGEAPTEPTPLPVSDPTIPFTVKSMGSRGVVAEEPESIVLAEETPAEPTPLPVSDPTIPFTAKSAGARDGVDEQSKPFAGEAKVQPPEVVTGGAQVEPLPVTNTKAEQPEVVPAEIEPEPLMAADIKAQPEVDDSLAMAEQDTDESAPASPVRKDALLEPMSLTKKILSQIKMQ